MTVKVTCVTETAYTTCINLHMTGLFSTYILFIFIGQESIEQGSSNPATVLQS